MLSREVFYIILVLLLTLNKSNAKSNKDLLSYQSCRTDASCKNNSFCFDNDQNKLGTCKCNNGFIFFGNHSFYECLKEIETVGSTCLLDDQCELTLGKDSECDFKNTCQCLPTAHFIPKSKSCFTTSRLNEICEVHENCVSPNNDQIYCTNGKCTCGLNQHVATNGSCIRSIHIGRICESDESCMHASAVCRNICTCRVGYVVADNEHTCLKGATLLGEDCQQLSQCNSYLLNSICYEGKCACNGGYHQDGNKCYQNKYINEECSESRECLSLELDCINGICTCNNCDNSSSLFSSEYLIVLKLLLLVIIFK